MLPQINDLFMFGNQNEKIELPSKTYQMNINNELPYLEEYLKNITFRIIDGDLVEQIIDEPADVNFTLVGGYLVVSTIEEED